MTTTGPASGAPRAAVAAADRLGAVFSGWRLDAVLGESPSNTVYAVSDRLGQKAALRLMHPQTRNDTGVRRRAFREAATIRGLAHAGTAAILLADITTTGEPYVVMERLLGLDAARLIQAAGAPLEPAVALAIVQQIADVLALAHARGVVHRAVQPVTTFVCRAGDVRLLDFGGALLPTDAGEQTLDALGVPIGPYSAPELREGTALGEPRADVFGLGHVLLWLLLGPETEAPSEPAVSEAQIVAVRRRLERLPVTLADDVIALLEKSCAWTPDKRYSHAGQLRDGIATLLPRLGVPDAEAAGTAIRDLVEPLVPHAEDDASGRAFLAYDLLRAIFERIERTLYQARRSRWDDPETEARVAEVLKAILEAVQRDTDGITFQIRPHAIELLGRPVWEPRHPFEVIPYRLFDSGFRKIRLLPSLSAEECRRFLRWMVTDPETDLGTEDDLATLYWRQAFESVRCDLVSSVVLQDLDEYDVLDRELQAIQSVAVQELHATVSARFHRDAGEVDATLQNPDEEALLSVVVRSSSGLLSDTLRHGLVEQLGAVGQNARLRLSELVVRVAEAESEPATSPLPAAFRHYVDEGLASDEPLGPVEVFASIRRQLAHRDRLASFSTGFQHHAAMRQILDASVRADGSPADPANARAIAAGLHAVLETSGPDVFDAVGAALARCTDDLVVAVLERYVGRFASGRAGNLEALLPDASVPGAVAILRAVWLLPDEGSVATTLAALRNPNVDVRLDAFARLVAGAPGVALEQFAPLLADNDASIRRTSIRIAVQGRLPGAFDVLHRRARSDAFDLLAYAERQQIVVAMLDLDGRRGEDAIAQQVLEEGAFTSRERDQTRILLAEILGDRATQESTLRTLRTLTGVRFWTSKPVRDAAKSAVDRLESRGLHRASGSGG